VGNSAQNELEAIQSKIEKIKSNILELKSQADLEPELTYGLTQQNTKLIQLESSIKDTEADYSTKISNVTLELSNTKNAILNIQNQIDSEYSQKLSQFKLESMTKTQQITSLLMEEKAIRSLILNELDSFKKQIQLYDQSLQMKNMLESKLIKQTNDLQIVKENINKTQKNVLIAEESKRLIKSYSLQKFQETLDSIGEIASNILRNVPNMSTASIYFEGCKETGSGSIKEEVTAFINMDGESDVDIKSLSGGERTAIDLAVDLAVVDILEIKAGKGADFFILDEPFDGLDSVGRAAIVDIIKGIDSSKRIIIVDHGAETKEIISDKIIAIRSGETSYVV
jgi:DNA repair exonuclease SbcCD ATPase subunit